MPSRIKKTVKTVKRYRKRNYRKKVPRTTKTSGVTGGTRNFNVLNTLRPRSYLFKDTFQFNDIVGTGTAVVSVNTFNIGLVPRYNALITMFKKYKIVNAKFRYRLRTIELTDQAAHPNILLRYNYDPDLVTSFISEGQMLRLSNVVQKQFIHNTPQGCNLEYSIKPAIMDPRYNASAVLKPSPMFNQWLDFTGTASTEVDHYGIQSWISTLPSGQIIDLDLQLTYLCTDLI